LVRKKKNKTPEELKKLAKKMQDISNRIFAETRKLKAKWEINMTPSFFDALMSIPEDEL
jgi:hypothetical protein